MKKIVLSFVAILGLGLSSFVFAQDISKNALGIRIGDNDGLGAEISYQRGLKENNRLELDLGFRSRNNFNIIKLAGIYQWVWNIEGGFNWYAGIGGGFVNFNSKNRNNRFDNDNDNDNDNNFSETNLFAAGDVGIEYNFDGPILVSLDFRPEFGFISNKLIYK